MGFWCGENTVRPRKPNGSQLARFLTDLHQKEKLALSTILVHKSVVATLSDPDNCHRLSSHPLVKQVLKSISLANPKQHRLPTWNIDTLISHLSMEIPEKVLKSLYNLGPHNCHSTLMLRTENTRLNTAEHIGRTLRDILR